MEEEVELYLEETKEKMEQSIRHLEHELSRMRAGKATPTMLDGIYVEYYGNKTPLNQVSNINTPDARSILVQPWEKNMLDPIEKAIMAANIGLTPINNGELIRINIPPLTEERRHQLVKQVKAEGETTKVGIRNIRKWANDEIRKLQKEEGLPEDDEKEALDNIQKLTDDFTKQIDALVEKKEQDILTI